MFGSVFGTQAEIRNGSGSVDPMGSAKLFNIFSFV